ncbi:hypothetical protein [Blastococcus deserti]|uniref:Glycosyltransferase involved in cell wall biosynthesis n=1 Tax=Blastococcus deserti TaxID=2259033 RepID=A0ABW4X4N7_9ACTN
MTLSDIQAPRAVPAPRRTGVEPAELVLRTPAPDRSASTFVSVVVIAEGPAAQIESDLTALDAALSAAYPVHEIVLVLSGARGRQPWARALARRQANLQVLGLLHECTDEVAFTAGLDGALGDVVVTARLGVDAPTDVVRCASMVDDDTGIVVGVDRAAGGGRRLALGLSRRLARYGMRDDDIASVSLGLRAYSRQALDAWLPRRDRDRVLRLLPSLSGYPSAVLDYTPGTRAHARSTTSLRQVLRSIFYASARPLRLAVGISVTASVINLLYALYVVIVGVFKGAVAGWTSTSLQTSVMFFLICVVIAIMAEFMYQSNETANERPAYRVAFEATSAVQNARDMLNVEAQGAAAVRSDDGRVAS